MPLKQSYADKSPGYNQGVLGTVSETPGFIDMAGIGSNGKVMDSTKQGGLAAAYYFGGIFGCFIGGMLQLPSCPLDFKY